MKEFTRRGVLAGTAATLGTAALASKPVGAERSVGHNRLFSTQAWILAAPTVVDGYVYVGDAEGTVHKVDAETGERGWSEAVGAPVYRAVTVSDGTVYVGDESGRVTALDVDDGDEDWRTSLEGSVLASPTVADGRLFVTDKEAVVALDADDGSEIWTAGSEVNAGSVLWTASPTVLDGRVYVGGLDSQVYALDAEDGTEEWTVETGDAVRSSPTVADGTVYVGSDDGTVYALDADDGSEAWTFDTDSAVRSSPTASGGTVYVGSQDNGLYALDAGDGSLEWRSEQFVSVDDGPTVVGDRYFVATGSFITHGTDGDATVLLEPEAGLGASSPVVVDGTLYAGFGSVEDGNRSGRLYAVDVPVEGSSDGSRIRLGTLGHHDDWASAPAARFLDVSVTETSVQDGTVEVSVAVENRGTLEADGEVTAAVGGTTLDSAAIDLAPGETDSLSFTYATRSGDAPQVEVTVENEHDSDAVTVDLDPPRLAVALEDVTDSVDGGAELSVTAVVENDGGVPATPDVDLLADGERLDSATLDLAVDGRGETTLAGTAPEEPGNVELTVAAGEATATTLVHVRRDRDDAADETETPAEDDDPSEPADDEAATADGEPADTADDDGPGFGVVSGLGGLGGAVYLLRRRLQDE